MDNLDYTREQYALMERLERGLLCQDLAEREQEIFCYLDSLRIVQPREDIEEGYAQLSQYGRRVLAARRQELLIAQEQKRRQKTKLNDRRRVADRKARDQAAQRKEDKKFQVLLSLLSATYSQVLAFLLGALLTNLDRLVPCVTRIVNAIKTFFH